MINLAKNNFFDTSALLSNYKLNPDDTNYISDLVFQELEDIKTSHSKDETVKYKARSLVRYLMSHRDLWRTCNTNWDAVVRLLNKRSSASLRDNNDSYLICEARYLARRDKIQFITSDAAQYLLACGFPSLHAVYYKETSHKENLWKGYQDVNLDDE